MKANTIEESLESNGLNMPRAMIIFLCFLIWVVDAFDIIAMSVAAPLIRTEWGLENDALGVVFTTALLGMMVGALTLAPFADRYGRKKILLGALFVLTISVLSIAFVNSMTQLIVSRFVTGLAIGSILASSTTVAAEFAPIKLRAVAVAFTVLGYSIGATIVGPIANVILESYDWRMIFVFGAGFTAVIFLLTLVVLPESIQFLKSNAHRDVSALDKINDVLRKIKCPVIEILPSEASASDAANAGPMALINREHRVRSILLWFCFFMGLFVAYYVLSWTPILFIEAGFERADGVKALTLYAFASIFGSLGIAFAFLKLSPTKTVAALIFLASILMLSCPLLRNSPLSLLYMLFAAGGFLISAANTGLYSIAPQLYPASIRVTGIGWAIGVGRLGAVVSPLLIGYLLTKDWTMYKFFGVFGIPYLLSAGAVLYLTEYKNAD